ncbi:MAG: aspartate carbamoyltransferase, partial [Lentisphaerae bacterium]|nr:aspartate carbamoyltransferase [Lentisphaerota bacterium]
SDLLIMRHYEKGLAEKMAWSLSNTERPVPIINAGSGKDEHPTQALLDIYTLQRSFEKQGGIDNKTVVFVGDLERGRTVRSLSKLLIKYKNVRQVFVAPDELQISSDILEILDENGTEYSLSNDFKKAIPEADAIYMTRIQDEWDDATKGSSKIDITGFSFNASDLQDLKANAVIMHPLPRRCEIDVDVDPDRRAVYWRQVRNGMWASVALIAHIFDATNTIRAFHGQ